MMTADRFALRDGEEDFDVILNDPNFVPLSQTGSARDGHSAARRMAQVDAPTNQGGPSSGTGTSSPTGCTPKQQAFIESLAAERGLEVKQVWLATKASASAAIDHLLTLPRQAAPVAPSTNVHPATDRQKEFVRTLLAERAGNPAAEAIRAALNAARDNDNLTVDVVSAAITALLEIPKTAAPTVPDGRYALAAEDGHFVFYLVSSPTEGTWAGRTFVVQLIGSVGSWSEQRLSAQVTRSILDRIAVNPEEAARMFGIKAEACGYCGSPLSNIQSRAAGYGETCAHKHGFFYPTEAEAKEILQERGVEI